MYLCKRDKTELMKKSVLFVVNNLNIGGVEKCLLTILNRLPADKYNLAVGVVNRTGDFLKYIPENVKVIEIESLHKNDWRWQIDSSVIRKALQPKHLSSLLMIPLLRIISKIKGTLIPLYSHYVNSSTDNMPEYDVAVSFQGPSQLLDYYVGKVIKAKKKIGWIHFDVDKFYINEKTTAETCKDFSNIFVVSNASLESFRRKVPSLADRSETMLNIIDEKQNAILAEKFNPYNCRRPNARQLVTVGRINHDKGQDQAVKAAKLLKDKGYDFEWTFVGTGNEIDSCRKLAGDLGISEVISFIGSTTNPYPYIKNADIYIQPSRNEGFCLTIGEAKQFGIPIVTTDFNGAREQLHSVKNSVIVSDSDPEKIADGIAQAWDMSRITPVESQVPTQIKRLMEVLDE